MLHISYSGLKFHKQNIYRKLGVSNRNEAQRKARNLGLNLRLEAVSIMLNDRRQPCPSHRLLSVLHFLLYLLDH